MSDDTLSEDEAQAFRERCQQFLAENATGISVEGGDPRDLDARRGEASGDRVCGDRYGGASSAVPDDPLDPR